MESKAERDATIKTLLIAGQQAVVEVLAALEHEQWMAWSKSLAEEEVLSEDRLKRWQEQWKPYSYLSEQDKEYDRIWARKVLNLLLSRARGYVWLLGDVNE